MDNGLDGDGLVAMVTVIGEVVSAVVATKKLFISKLVFTRISELFDRE